MPKLIVLEGPNRGAMLTLIPGDNRIGRDPEFEISLPDRSISRRHASLAVTGDEVRLIDLGSTNATYLNGLRVTGARPVKNGDEIRLGDSVLVFVADGADEHPRGEILPDETDRVGIPAQAWQPPPGRGQGARPRYLVGESSYLARVSELIARCAPLETTVLIHGESGTGKELAAEALHRLSRRAGGPFVAVNCATLDPALLESELFGHERGSFTGAVARKLGKLEFAHQGTLFLDEVGELPLEAQAKLLRAIDRRQFSRVGGNEVLTTSARFVAATHRDLSQLVRDGRFREDLLFRLKVVEIVIPPLRARRDDILPLVKHFLAELREKIPARAHDFTPAALCQMMTYSFPGNARELRNLIERCLIFCENELIDVDDLPQELRESPGSESMFMKITQARAPATDTDDVVVPPDGAPVETLGAAEKVQIERALVATGGNKSKAARLLDIDRNTLHAKMKRHGLTA